ncbi:hypothetical protein [Cysteiniphilum marinum]|uniref:hypothetical protein n=1 Tax=Cysteiniphilum marinum TaxID=2774191 RepID=UPI001939CF9C|nr:hypothetical protein [Cysteiniphilum marinum]
MDVRGEMKTGRSKVKENETEPKDEDAVNAAKGATDTSVSSDQKEEEKAEKAENEKKEKKLKEVNTGKTTMKNHDKKLSQALRDDRTKAEDIDLAQAEDTTEKTLDHISKRLNQHDEVEVKPRRDFTGLLLMFAVIFSFGAMAFSIVGMLSPNGLDRAYYKQGVEFLNEKNTERLQALKQELIDAGKSLNQGMVNSLNNVETALVQVSDNIKKLNQNMAQVQANISAEISNQSAPDLSAFSESINELKASIQEIKSQTRLINANNAFKKEVAARTVKSAESESDVTIEYIGNSPNGAILKITSANTVGDKAKYITVKVGQMTAYGEVSFLDNQTIVINGKRITKTLSESK